MTAYRALRIAISTSYYRRLHNSGCFARSHLHQHERLGRRRVELLALNWTSIAQRLSGLPSESVDYNQGLCGWLALYYFPHLCPPDDDGKQNPLKEQLYIPPKVDQPLAYRTYYRHLIAGPYRIRQLHGQESQALLWGPIEKHPDLLEQLAARQDLITNTEFIKAVVQLYFQRDGDGAWSPKRGAVTRTRPGNLRRLKELLDQLDRTCDLYGLTAEQFLDLLPDEYAHWRRSA